MYLTILVIRTAQSAKALEKKPAKPQPRSPVFKILWSVISSCSSEPAQPRVPSHSASQPQAKAFPGVRKSNRTLQSSALNLVGRNYARVAPGGAPALQLSLRTLTCRNP